jgi:site-specific DNA recombinase
MIKRAKRSNSPVGPPIALIYIRVSTEDQAREGVSLDAQRKGCRQYVANQEGWSIEDEYEDHLSGTKDARPAYQQLLEHARQLRANGRRVVIVVARLDRFGRRVLERVRCREEFKVLGIPTHSVNEGGEVSDLVANVLASVAEEEVRRLGERVAEARRHIVLSGWAYPTGPAFGYVLRPATDTERAQGAPKSVIVLDEPAAEIVREVFTRAASGETVRSVARWIASLPPAMRGYRSWAYSNVRVMLSCPTYCARPAIGVDDVLARPRAHWEALIDDHTWAAVQQQIASHSILPRNASGNYLLTGMIRCPTCGGRMTGRGTQGRSQSRYRCSGRIAGATHPKPGCSVEVPMPQVDAALQTQVGDLLNLLHDPRSRAALEHAWKQLSHDNLADREQRIQTLEQTVQAARRRLGDAAVLYVDHTLDREGYEALRDLERPILESAEAELIRLRTMSVVPSLPPLADVFDQAGTWQRVMEDTSDVVALRAVLAAVIENVTPVRVGYGKYRVDIVWTPLAEAIRRHALAA